MTKSKGGMALSSWIGFAVFFLLSQSEIATIDGKEHDEAHNDQKTSKCGMYLAPSSIPNSGLGMFLGDKAVSNKETITLGDVVIPLFEYDWNNFGNENVYPFLIDEYSWNAVSFPGMDEEADDVIDPDEAVERLNAVSPGVGSAANSDPSRQNVDDNWVAATRPVRWDSPGTGASTLYSGRGFYAIRDLPPGAEIFVTYGEEYFTSRSKAYGYVPMPKDHKKADKILKKIKKLQKKMKKKLPPERSDKITRDLYTVVKSQSKIWKTSRPLNALPSNYSRIDAILEHGGCAQQNFNESIREISWLEGNGQCMDNIKPGESKNPDAGNGAFANRFIPEGGLVAPAPLLHIRDVNTFKMYQPKPDPDGYVYPDNDGPFTYQLLLNYCFGHGESSLLLCPYGLLTSLINHSHDAPNARIEWSKEMRHPEWKESGVSIWGTTHHTGLAFDFVALRDIEEDEEILIDYGSEWEEAWQKHMQSYVPRKNGERYIPSFEFNEMMDIEYRTVEDEPYEADGLRLWCRGFYLKMRSREHQDGYDRTCRILRNLGHDRYVVQVVYVDDDRDGEVDGHDRTYFELGTVIWNLPSDAFYVEDLPYTRDTHMPNAFRFPMAIPDDIFPEAWKGYWT